MEPRFAARDAGSFDIVVQVEGSSGSFAFPQRSNGTLAAGADTPRLGILFPDVAIPGTFTITAVADPPTETMPGGEVWEWDKGNNASLRSCTLN